MPILGLLSLIYRSFTPLSEDEEFKCIFSME